MPLMFSFPRYLTHFDPKSAPHYFFDVLIVGGGLAGLRAAVEIDPSLRVLVVTKDILRHSSSSWAQGGIAISKNTVSDIDAHVLDTLSVGKGICDEGRVKKMVAEGPKALDYLMDLGMQFDSKDGGLSFALEAGHQKPRIVHCKDATGAAIKDVLDGCVSEQSMIHVFDYSRVIKLCVDDGRCWGVWVSGPDGCLSLMVASCVVLATGGYSQLYASASTPIGAIGDGIALAYNAGVVVEDMEMTQFHPTVFMDDESDVSFLISEAVRGAGAKLKNASGELFLHRYEGAHELVPRDVLSRAIFSELRDGGQVYLDLSSVENFAVRFPTIYSKLCTSGYQSKLDKVPVKPAAHFTIGGIAIDEVGRSNVDGLFAIGECAASRVHGANRLASNSLLEGVVFALHVAAYIRSSFSTSKKIPSFLDDVKVPEPVLFSLTSPLIQSIKLDMWRYAGVYRDGCHLERLSKKIATYKHKVADDAASFTFDEQVFVTVSHLVFEAALYRKESRGVHYRRDFSIADAAFLGHVQQSHGAPMTFSKL